MANQVGVFKNPPEPSGHPSLVRPALVTSINADTVRHNLIMKNLGFPSSDEASNNLEPNKAQKTRLLRIKQCIESLNHAIRCENQGCDQLSCAKIKHVLAHQKVCNGNVNGKCQICKQFYALCCYHAKDCNDDKCAVPFCLKIKFNQGIKQRLHQTGQWTAGRVLIANNPNNMALKPMNEPMPRMINQTAQTFYRPAQVAQMQQPFALTIPPLIRGPSIVRRSPFYDPKRFDVVPNFDQFVQQQPKPCFVGIDPEKQNAFSKISNEWRKSISSENRSHLILKFMQKIFPTADLTSMHDNRLYNSIFTYAQNAENDVYETANSKSEYFELLAAKLNGIQMALDKKRKERMANQKNATTKPYDRVVSKL